MKAKHIALALLGIALAAVVVFLSMLTSGSTPGGAP